MIEDTFLRSLPTQDVVQGLEGTLKHLRYLVENGHDKEYHYLTRCARFGIETRLDELHRRGAHEQYKKMRREYERWNT